MKQILVIARREFLTTVTRPGYILMVVGMPLFFVIVSSIGYWTGSAAEKSSKKPGPIAIVDLAQVVDFSLADRVAQERGPNSEKLTPNDDEEDEPPVRFVPYRDVNQAIADMRQGRLSACYVLDTDYVPTGKVVVFSPAGGFLSNLVTPGRAQLHRLLRASLMKNQIADERFDRILNPSHLKEMRVSQTGQIEPAGEEFEEVGKIFGPLGVFILLTMAIFFSSGFLLQGIAEEKQNRVIVVILSSVKPTQLLAGKILGLGAAGLLQVALYVALIFIPASAMFTFIHISAGQILLSLVYFVLGYLLFASLMAATGVIGNTVQESSQLSAIWTMTSMIPLFMIGPLSQDPNSVLARVLSFFPLTAPTTMLLRLSATKVPTLDVLISIAMLMLGIYLAVTGAAKIFRASSLMYGKRPSVPEIIRWLREA